MKNSVCNWPFPFKSFLAVQLSRCKARFTLRSPSSRKDSLRVSRVRYSVFRPNPENDTEFKTQSTVNLHDSRLPCSCSRSHAFLLLLQRFGFRLSVSIFRFLLSSAYRSTLGEPPSFLFGLLPRKEVIQPHLPIRLPCYDFTPVIGLALDGWLLAVASPALGTPNSHGVTGGVYKARERIHRGMLIRDY